MGALSRAPLAGEVMKEGETVVDTLKLDLDALGSAADDLTVISAEFTFADSYAESLGADVGHTGLAARLQEFTESWRVRRAEMEESVSALAEILRTTVRSFEEADAEIATNVRGESSATGGGRAPLS